MVQSRKILVLGSGMVSPPAIEFLARFRDNAITVASANLSEADSRVKGLLNVKVLAMIGCSFFQILTCVERLSSWT